MHPNALPSTRTPTPARRRHRRLALGALAALAGTAALLGSTAGPVAAADEFPPAPTVDATIGCLDGAAYLQVDLGNLSGLSSAHFDVSQDGSTLGGYDVAAFDTTHIQLGGTTENVDTTLTVTASGGFTYEETFTADCFGFTGGVVLACDGLQPVLTAEVSAIGEYGDEVRLDVGDATVATGSLSTGESTTFSAEVPDGEPFAATLASVHDGVIADLVGTPRCAPPITTTTVVPVTVMPTVPTQVIPQEVVDPAPYVAPTAAPTELPRTGASTVPLAVVGTTLLGLGVAARRFAARRA